MAFDGIVPTPDITLVETPEEDGCPACQGPHFERDFGCLHISGYEHRSGCPVGQMLDSVGGLRFGETGVQICTACRHTEALIREGFRVQGYVDCPACLDRYRRC